MSFWEMLDTVLLKPLELIFEVVYMLAFKVIGNPGLSIIALSLFMNFLVLPLYLRADAIQEEQHALEKKLQKGVDHIRKTFRGDERMMILQTYYRQNHYRPVYVLRSAVSLFLQIPFFIAAYRFLSGLYLIRGVSFGPITDLGAPDGMLAFGGGSTGINLMPFIMTAVNLLSCAVFTKDSPLKAKIQLYAMALFFLVFLYHSPAGLVFYWTLNNVFSLVKTCFYKLKNPGKALCRICSAAGILLAVNGVLFYHFSYNLVRRKIFLAGIGILLQIPLLYHRIRGKRRKKEVCDTENRKLFFAGALFLTMLIGALIPSAVIKASPQEFVDLTCFYHPLWFIAASFGIAAGLFIFWAGVFYYLSKPSARVYFDRAVLIFSGIALIDYMFFGKDLGLLNPQLKFEIEPRYSEKEIFVNAAVVIVAAALLYAVCVKRRKQAAEALLVGTLVFSVMTFANVTGIADSVNSINAPEETEMPGFRLSKTGKNVIVLMLDRALGEYIPYIFRNKPELEEKFSGFTYYANTVSFGCATNLAAPALFGGYEYTPLEMNKRDKESLGEKHTEAVKVLPVLFDQNGYEVTVCDPPYAGYQIIPDLSVYNDYPDIKKYNTMGRFDDSLITEEGIKNNKRNFFCYGIFKAVPVCFQSVAYDKGKYYRAEAEMSYTNQYCDGLYMALGMSQTFMASYNVLEALPEITEITEEKTDTFLMMSNNTTHELMMLQEPDYVPELRVDNREYAGEYPERFTLNGRSLKMENDRQVANYQVNVAALVKVGKWFDYMREQGVYDNTRIILVSDHGISLRHSDDLIVNDIVDMERYYSLLMVKDFGDEVFQTSEAFMTCADVPAIATEDAIANPLNPFTGKRLGYGDKASKPQYIFMSLEPDIAINNGNQFLPADWYTVQEDMRKLENWKKVAEDAVLPPEE